MRDDVEMCSMPRNDDRETDQIGKLIDAGYPKLAASTFRSRWRYMALARVFSSVLFAATIAWYWPK
jgi:hypothetical protein